MENTKKSQEPKAVLLQKESEHTANMFKVLLAIALCLAVLGLIDSTKSVNHQESFDLKILEGI